MSENTNTVTTMREADNKVFIEGLVSEINFEIKEIQGKNAMTGDISIEVGENSVHTVDVFTYQVTKEGKENSIYKGLITVMNEFKSIAKVGREEAEKVRISGAKLVVNDFYNQSGDLKSAVKINTNFVNRLKVTDEFNPKAEFEVEIYIQKMIDEIDKKTTEPTGRKLITGLVPIYNGKVVPMQFVVTADDADGVESVYEIGSTVKIYGNMVNHAVTVVKVIPVAIGKPKETVTTYTTKELVFTGGSEPYAEENKARYLPEVIKTALAVREEYLAELKEKKAHGGGTKSVTEPKKNDIDLPF